MTRWRGTRLATIKAVSFRKPPEVSGLAHSEIMKSEMPSKFWSYTTRQGTLPRSTSINHLHLPEEGTLDKGICLSEIQLDIRSRTEG